MFIDEFNCLFFIFWICDFRVFEFFLNFEKKNYEDLYALCDKAEDEHDFDAEEFLENMIAEQVKSVFEWEGLVKKAKGYSLTPGLLWVFDSEMD